MRRCGLRFQSLDELRQFVHNTLCQLEQLEANAFPTTERLLVRGGKPCGMLFHLHGPRSVLFTAIWETLCHTVLFYDSRGERFQRTQLAPEPALVEALRR